MDLTLELNVLNEHCIPIARLTIVFIIKENFSEY